MPSVVDRQVDWPHVRFGSLADICSAKSHVRFTPESRTLRGSVKMSACVPIADIQPFVINLA